MLSNKLTVTVTAPETGKPSKPVSQPQVPPQKIQAPSIPGSKPLPKIPLPIPIAVVGLLLLFLLGLALRRR